MYSKTNVKLDHVKNRGECLSQNHWSIVRQSGHNGGLNIVSGTVNTLWEMIQTLDIESFQVPKVRHYSNYKGDRSIT